jgi:uncharacterized protein (DUF433 family)
MADEFPIDEKPGINGGYPVVRGTRTPVRTIVAFFRQNGDVSKIAALLPHLTRDQIQACLAYYRANPSRVDEDFSTNERAWQEATASRWPV